MIIIMNSIQKSKRAFRKFCSLIIYKNKGIDTYGWGLLLGTKEMVTITLGLNEVELTNRFKVWCE
jgi:hypothetical protein